MNAFSEGLRQELLGKRVRVGVVGPGTVDTEIFNHLAAPSREAFEQQTAGMVKLRPEDIADAVLVHGDSRPPGGGQPHVGARGRTDLVMYGRRDGPWVIGDHFGRLIPADPEALRSGGPRFLTDAFRASGVLSADNTVRRITDFREIVGGSTGRKVVVSVEYDKPLPGLHTDLFVKFSRDFDDPTRDRGKTQMEPEVRFASLSRVPGFPIAVPGVLFGNYQRRSGTGLLITERIRFGANGIERQYHKCLDYEMPEPVAHYRALLTALARLAGHGEVACHDR